MGEIKQRSALLLLALAMHDGVPGLAMQAWNCTYGNGDPTTAPAIGVLRSRYPAQYAAIRRRWLQHTVADRLREQEGELSKLVSDAVSRFRMPDEPTPRDLKALVDAQAVLLKTIADVEADLATPAEDRKRLKDVAEVLAALVNGPIAARKSKDITAQVTDVTPLAETPASDSVCDAPDDAPQDTPPADTDDPDA